MRTVAAGLLVLATACSSRPSEPASGGAAAGSAGAGGAGAGGGAGSSGGGGATGGAGGAAGKGAAAGAGGASKPTFDRIAVGFFQSCARATSGDWWCWGDNRRGELGLGTVDPVTKPTLVPALSGANVLSMSDGRACAVWLSGAMKCWGCSGLAWNKNPAPLGTGDAANNCFCNFDVTPVAGTPTCSASQVVTAPKAVGGSYTSVGTNGHYTGALATDGTVFVWGAGVSHSLGDGDVASSFSLPTAVKNGATALKVSQASFGSDFAMAGDAAQRWSWGFGDYGQNGQPSAVVGVPTPLTWKVALVQVRAGWKHGCGWTQPGQVYCWGWNANQQLGQPGVTSSAEPLSVPGTGLVDDLTIGKLHTCVRSKVGAVACWGAREHTETQTEVLAVPTQVAGLDGSAPSSTAMMIDSGLDHTCALRDDGEIVCWGANSWGQCGADTGGAPVGQPRVVVW